MKKKNILSIAIAVTLVAVIGIGATIAYFTDSDEAQNVITMGSVEIELEEPIFDENTDGGKLIENVVPNQVITKDPTIKVIAGSEACYLRAKIEITGLEEVTEGGNGTHIQDLLNNIDIGSDWVLSSDGYYYYQSAVEKNSDTDQDILFFGEVTIPSTWGSEFSGISLGINVSAEAVQFDFFEPATDDGGIIIGWPM